MITDRINQIIDRRIGRNGHVGRLPIITQKKEFFNTVLSTIVQFQTLREQILNQIQNNQGEYYTMSLSDPMFQTKVEAANPDAVILEIEKALKECERLEKRFNRETINISVIGLAGQGKSRLLQTIGNLDNKIIPAADSTDCTGAKSVICNHDGPTHAKIIFYQENEMIEQIQRYIDAVGINFRLTQLSQIPTLQSVLDQSNSIISEVAKTASGKKHLQHLKDYIDHYEEYRPLINTTHDESDESKIRDYVAQYREDGSYIYYYLAVKEAQIFTKFNYEDAGKIVLVDTIGLGDTALGIQEKLISTLQNDSDAAILLRKPENGRETVLRQVDIDLCNILENTIGINQLKEWLFMAINASANLGNRDYGKYLKENLEDENFNCALLEVVDCANSEEVEEKLLVPLLNHLSTHLDNVDDTLLKTANDSFRTCHQRYVEFCNNVAEILKDKIREMIDLGDQFDDLYDKLNLGRQLERLNKEYSDHDHISDEVEQDIRRVLSEIKDCCPSKEELIERLSGGTRNSRPDVVYDNVADFTRAAICDKFDEINSITVLKMQNTMKQQIIDVLRSEDGGRLGSIMLDSVAADAPALEWIKAFIEEKLERFPLIKAAFEGILDYRLSVESLLDYRLNRSLVYLDIESPEFASLPKGVTYGSYEEIAETINQNLLSTIVHIAKQLLEDSQDIMKVPYNSFFARIRKLREQIIYSKEGERQLKSLYRRFATQVWSSQIKAIVNQNNAIENIDNQLQELNAKRALNQFIIKLIEL